MVDLMEDTIETLAEVWGLPELRTHADVKFSSRLRVSLGRTRPDTGRVRLNNMLRSAPDGVLQEALCHELAHVAAFLRHGSAIRPHGAEWRALMQEAGLEPRMRIKLPGRVAEETRAVDWYLHVCPVCQSRRRARRRMKAWRCRTCVEAGLEGVMNVSRSSTP